MKKGKGTLIRNSRIGKGTKIWHYVNIYDSLIGENCIIGSYSEIGRVIIGDRCKIECNVFVCEGVTIEDDVLIGPHVVFTNDEFPKPPSKDWVPVPTLVKKGARIGANATIRCGVVIGENVRIGCGSVVTHNIPDGETWVGNPARPIGEKHDS
jgi:UDP-2-acetamido-3-amino-2,3-dideoxy-glucuronate N-acetyltransferase